MSLWSSTNIQADDDCGRQGIWLRLGKKGVSWDGYRVGSWVHDYIHAHAVGAAKPKLGELSVLEQQDAKKCLYNFREMGLLDAPEGAVWEQSYIGLVNSDGSVYGWADAPSTAIRGEDWDPASFTDETWVRIPTSLSPLATTGRLRCPWGLRAGLTTSLSPSCTGRSSQTTTGCPTTGSSA